MLLQRVDKLGQASKIGNLQNVWRFFGYVAGLPTEPCEVRHYPILQGGFVEAIWKHLLLVRFGSQVKRCPTDFAFTTADRVGHRVQGEAERKMTFVVRLEVVLRRDAFVKLRRVLVERLVFDGRCEVDSTQAALGHFFEEGYAVGNRTQKVLVRNVNGFSKNLTEVKLSSWF